MSDNRRVIDIYVNVGTSGLVDSNGSSVTSNIELFRKSQHLFRCHLRLDDNTTYFTPPSGAEWLFVISNSYDPETNPNLVISDNAQFNIAADWSSLSATGGKICFRVNTATTALTADMASTESKTMVAELWMIPLAGDATLMVQFNVTMKNIVADVGADSTLIYTNTNMLKFDGDDIVLQFADGTVAQRWSKT